MDLGMETVRLIFWDRFRITYGGLMVDVMYISFLLALFQFF